MINTLTIKKNSTGDDSLLFIFSFRDENNYDATLAEKLHVQKHKKKQKR